MPTEKAVTDHVTVLRYNIGEKVRSLCRRFALVRGRAGMGEDVFTEFQLFPSGNPGKPFEMRRGWPGREQGAPQVTSSRAQPEGRGREGIAGSTRQSLGVSNLPIVRMRKSVS